MMKIHSIIHAPSHPRPDRLPRTRPRLTGHPCTLLEMSAKGPSSGAIHRAGLWVVLAVALCLAVSFRRVHDPAGPLHRMPCG